MGTQEARLKGIGLALMVLAAAGLAGCDAMDGRLVSPPWSDLSSWLTQGAEGSETPSTTPPATARVFPCPATSLPTIDADSAVRVEELAVLTLPGLSYAAITPSQEWLVLVSSSTIELFNLECIGNPVYVPIEGRGEPLALALDDRFLAVAFQGGEVALWQMPSGDFVRTFSIQAMRLAFSPAGDLLAAGAQDYTLELWNLSGDAPLRTLLLGSKPASITFSPDGAQLAVVLEGDLEENVELWDVTSGEKVRTYSWPERTGPIYFVRFSPDWRTSAWVSRGTVLMMDMATGEPIVEFGHQDYVDELAYSPSGEMVVTSSSAEVDGQLVPVVKLWSVSSGEGVSTLVHETLAILVTFSAGEGLLVAGTETGDLVFWDTGKEELLNLLHAHGDLPLFLTFALNDRLVVSGSYDGTVMIVGVTP